VAEHGVEMPDPAYVANADPEALPEPVRRGGRQLHRSQPGVGTPGHVVEGAEFSAQVEPHPVQQPAFAGHHEGAIGQEKQERAWRWMAGALASSDQDCLLVR
jgi:hypothetical protein